MPVGDVMRTRERSELGSIHQVHVFMARTKPTHSPKATHSPPFITCTPVCTVHGTFAWTYDTILAMLCSSNRSTTIQSTPTTARTGRVFVEGKPPWLSRLCYRLRIPRDDTGKCIPALGTTMMFHKTYALQYLPDRCSPIECTQQNAITAKHTATEYDFTGLETRGRDRTVGIAPANSIQCCAFTPGDPRKRGCWKPSQEQRDG